MFLILILKFHNHDKTGCKILFVDKKIKNIIVSKEFFFRANNIYNQQ